MCGVVAIVDPDGVPAGIETKGIAALSHRGPDGVGTWRSSDGTVALAHARLAFLDLEHGGQPLSSESGRVVAVVNGEHYDHVREAARLGVSLRTACDAELWPNLVERLGVAKAARRWRGELAGIAWNSSTRTLTAVRDRAGAKPLVYAKQGRRLLVASEARALFAMGVPRVWDVESVRLALALQYTAPERTLFEGVRVVPPGSVLTFEGDRLEIASWWSWPSVERSSIEPGDAVARVRQVLEDAVRVRLRGEREVGLLLSGGIDSASVTALAVSHSSRKLAAFTVSFAHADWDEAARAEEQAEALGLRHVVVDIGARDIVDRFDDAITAGENVAINGHVSAKWLLHREVRKQGISAVLSGEGSDELLLGYPHLRQDVDASRAASLARTNLASTGIQLPHGDTLPLDRLTRAFGAVPAFLRAKASLGARTATLVHRDFDLLPALDTFASAHPIDDLDDRPNPRKSAWLWARTAFATSILRTLGDAQEMAHGVEGRLPFLDPEVMDTAFALGTSVALRDGIEKWPLREAMRGVVVESIRTREKHPFMAPPLSLVDRGLAREWLGDVCGSEGARTQPFFDPEAVLRRFDALGDDPREHVAWEPAFFLCASLAVLARGTSTP